MTVASELTRLINSKAAIKSAIEAKGVSVGTIRIDAYVDKISAIGVFGTPTITRSSGAFSDAQTKYINTPITPLTYDVTNATNVTFLGLPTGVTAVWGGNKIIITGIATAVQALTTFIITVIGVSETITKTGNFTINPANTIALTSAAATDAQSVAFGVAITPITYATTGATNFTADVLPAGITAALSNNVLTISGTPTYSGKTYFQILLTGGSGTGSVVGSITVAAEILNNTITRTSGAFSDAQTKYVNTQITPITYATTGATGATFSGLPTGVTGSWTGNTIVITGIPTVAQPTTTYTITLTGGKGTITKTGNFTINPANTIALTSAAATDAQSVAFGVAITPITYATTGATSIGFSGLPDGVTGTFSNNIFTIIGTPTVSGKFYYELIIIGGSGTGSATGSVTIAQEILNNTISRTSGAFSDAQTKGINTYITPITYATTGATGAIFSGLPTGVTGVWAANVIIIMGIPTVAQPQTTFTITLTGGKGTITKTGTFTINPDNTIALTSALGTDAQSVGINTAITPITYATTGATGAYVENLPTGVTGSWSGNIFTISGTPNSAGASLTYKVTLTGGYGVITKTGAITVNPLNTISRTSGAFSDAQTKSVATAITPLTYITSGATGATFSGLPTGVTGVWAYNTIIITGTPTVVQVQTTFTITLTGGYGTITRTGTFTINP